MRWAANERKRQRLVQQRTVQQVVADIAKLVPELGGGAAPRPGEGEYYLHEPDGDKVDAAAAANLRRKPNPKDKAANGKQSDKPFGGRRYNDDYAKEQKAKRNAGKGARAVGQDPGST